MADLKLVYIDLDKNERTVSIERTVFMIGRSSENDLAIPDSRLSREHLKIERLDDVYMANDVGSSNGTLFNGRSLTEAVAIKDKDEFDLGGGLLLTALLTESKADEPEPAAVPVSPKPAAAAAASTSGSSISPMIFLLVPTVGIVLLLAVGGIFLLLRDTGKTVAGGDDPDYSDSSGVESTPERSPTPKKPIGTESSSTPTTGSNGNNSPVVNGSGDNRSADGSANDVGSSVEQNGAAFLRSIAQNEPKAFLTGEQSDIVAKKIKQVTSSALADNINSARKNSAKLKEIAAAKNLRPQLIATAAIAKLGNQRGDVVQTAQGMADILAVLSTQVGNEFGDDVLMMIAVYDQGAAGDTMKLRNTLQSLTTKFPESARTIRTIWFLKKNSQITDQEYDFALRFLAIGTITQNPKGFNVNAEPLIL